MAVVATAERGLIVYQLENQPSEFRRIESPLKHQVGHRYTVPDLTSLSICSEEETFRVHKHLPSMTESDLRVLHRFPQVA